MFWIFQLPRLFKIWNDGCFSRDNFASVRADKMLLMVTVITAAVYIVDRKSHEKVRF